MADRKSFAQLLQEMSKEHTRLTIYRRDGDTLEDVSISEIGEDAVLVYRTVESVKGSHRVQTERSLVPFRSIDCVMQTK